jgi:hypothetical protein
MGASTRSLTVAAPSPIEPPRKLADRRDQEENQ